MRRLLLTALLAATLAGALLSAAPAQTPAVPTVEHTADPVRGEAMAKKCLACHEFTEDGPNKLGPRMFGIVGAPVASVPNYYYSEALLERGKMGLTWTPTTLALFLANPRGFVPGNKMAFAGIRSEAEIADIIAYMISLSPDYVPSSVDGLLAPGTTQRTPSDRVR